MISVLNRRTYDARSEICCSLHPPKDAILHASDRDVELLRLFDAVGLQTRPKTSEAECGTNDRSTVEFPMGQSVRMGLSLLMSTWCWTISMTGSHQASKAQASKAWRQIVGDCW